MVESRGTRTTTLSFSNSTISENEAKEGGAIHAIATGVMNISFVNVTMAYNTADVASSIYHSAEFMSMKNAFVASLTPEKSCSLSIGSITSSGNNIDSGSTCRLNSVEDRSNTQPGLGPLPDNGGPTKTHALQLGSAAVDACDNTGRPSADQRSEPRPRNGNRDGNSVCDIGAFEAPGQLRGTLSAGRPVVLPNNVLHHVQITQISNAPVTVNGVSVAASASRKLLERGRSPHVQ